MFNLELRNSENHRRGSLPEFRSHHHIPDTAKIQTSADLNVLNDRIEISSLIMHDVLMKTVRYVYWQDSEMWLGYIEEFPDYMTQGETLEELRENLKDIYEEITNGHIPGVRHVADLQIA